MKYDIRSTQGDVLGHIELADGLEVVAQASAPTAPPAPPQMEEVKTMTDAAGSFTYEQYRESGWSDNALLANGLMKIEMRRMEEPGELHPSVANQQLGEQWQPEPAPPVPETPVPPAPSTPEPPAAPGVPTPPSAPQAPGVPTPPPAGEHNEGPAAGLPDGLRETDSVPHVPGREFIIKGRSFEKVVDRDHVPFDARIHGIGKDSVPATKQDGTFKKKRGVANEDYEAILAQLTGEGQAQAAPAAPTPPPAPGAPSVPDVPSAPAAPQTAPPQPDNMDALKNALSDWGDEV